LRLMQMMAITGQDRRAEARALQDQLDTLATRKAETIKRMNELEREFNALNT
jgi:hypothetical protein